MVLQKWMSDGKAFRQTGGGHVIDNLPLGIYQVNFNPMSGWSLDRTGDKFVFDYKLYGVHTGIVDRILRAYPNLKGNLGVLFNGLKGTGKTVTAKVLANKLELPVIIVKSFGRENTALIEYLSSINCDCILFFDEFEKQFDEEDFSILQIMDGVYTSDYRRVFLLTTNKTNINENLISRPSRVRYMKEFGNLELEVVRDYLQDNLEDKSKINDVITFLDTLIFSTIDILKSVVEEINIFGFDEFIKGKNDFNVKAATYDYQVVKLWCGNRMPLEPERLKQMIKDYTPLVEYYKTNYSLTPEMTEKYAEIREHWGIGADKRTLYEQTKFDTLKLGERFGNDRDEKVAMLDKENGIVICKDECNNDFVIYFVLNPKAQASLYTQPASLIL